MIKIQIKYAITKSGSSGMALLAAADIVQWWCNGYRSYTVRSPLSVYSLERSQWIDSDGVPEERRLMYDYTSI